MADKNECYFVVQIQDAAAFYSQSNHCLIQSKRQSNHCILRNGYFEFWSDNRLVARLDDSWQTPNSSISLIKDGQLLDAPPVRSWWFTPLKQSDVNSTPVDYLINSVLWLMVLVVCCFVAKCSTR